MPNSIYPITIYYDASCPLCMAEMGNLMLRNREANLVFVDVSATPGASPLPGVPYADLMRLLHARTVDGGVIRGVPALRAAYEGVGLGWVTRATTWPVIDVLADALYPVVARHRQRIPRFVVRWLFEGAARRAAQHAAASGSCSQGQCTRR